MAVDLSFVDLVALIEQHATIRFGNEVGKTHPVKKGGPCPFCGLGTDRFAVFVDEVPQRYVCGIHGNGCGAHGDALTFVREYRGIEDFEEACELLHVDTGTQYTGKKKEKEQKHDKPPTKKWMETAKQFCIEAKNILWSDAGLPARRWLYSRGLTDETIHRARIGLNLLQGYQDADAWGMKKKVWVSRGITLPYLIAGDIWKVTIRRSDKDISAHNAALEAQGKKKMAPKYLHIAGSSNGLYCYDTIQPGQPLVLVEGEFDCLSLQQSTNRSIAAVATGSTVNGREEKWVQSCAGCSPGAPSL